MVVVPTENDVRLHYDRSRSDLFFYLLTLAGIALLVVLPHPGRRRPRRAAAVGRWRRPAPAADPAADRR